jgi:outer membrane protein TolC
MRTASAARAVRKREIEVKLSLADAVRMGLENNLDIRLSRLDDDIRQREILIAKAVFDPFFNLGTNYAKNRDPSVSFLDLGSGGLVSGVSVNPSETFSYFTGLSGTSHIGTQYDLRLEQVQRDRPAASAGGLTSINPVTTTAISLTARQPLLKGAWYEANTASIRIAHNNSLLSREQLELTATNTVFLIEQAYWQLVFTTQNLEAKVRTLQLSEENVENVRKKKDVGKLAAIDVTTAESQAALRRAELDEAILLREESRDNLLDLINYTRKDSLKALWQAGSKVGPFDNVEVICTTEPPPEIPDLNRDRALALAFENRPEYRQLELNVNNQEIRIGVAKNALLPALDVLGGWTQLGLEETFGESYDELGSGDFYDWFVGLEFSVPISNRGPRSVYRNARDELRKLKVSKVSLENQIVIEVDQAIRRIEILGRKTLDLQERVRLQTELLRAEEVKLNVGTSIAYTVSVIANDLVDSITQSLRAKADFQNAKIELLRATGSLLQQHRIEVLEPR